MHGKLFPGGGQAIMFVIFMQATIISTKSSFSIPLLLLLDTLNVAGHRMSLELIVWFNSPDNGNPGDDGDDMMMMVIMFLMIWL